MEIQLQGDKIAKVKMGDRWIALRDFKMENHAELEKHVNFFEKYTYSAWDGYPWDEEELKKFLKDSSNNQLKMLETILNEYPKRVRTKYIVDALGAKKSQAIAGLLAGFTRRTKSEFGNKEKFIMSEWDMENLTVEYWINPAYVDFIKGYFKMKQEA